MSIEKIKHHIESIAKNKNLLKQKSYEDTVYEVIELLNTGKIRIAEKRETGWILNTWIKEAILLYFSITKMQVKYLNDYQYFDKIPLKKNLKEQGIRLVPPGAIRYGSFLEKGTIVMPGYVNIGAYVGAGTMVDTWATVGSCAQIGSRVHLSGGVGIGGSLEPLQSKPVIIEDDVFVGSRSIVVEGVRVCEKAVLGAGVVLTSSTPIIDVRGKNEVIHKGIVPKNSVIIPGTRVKSFPSGKYHIPCALLIGERNMSTNLKTSLNDTLREFSVGV